MILTKKALPRRTFLRGVGAALAIQRSRPHQIQHHSRRSLERYS